MFIAALFTIRKTWKQPKCPSMGKWTIYILYNYKLLYMVLYIIYLYYIIYIIKECHSAI